MPHSKKKRLPNCIVMQLALAAQKDPRSARQLAEEDGISYETWRSWTSGRRDPSLTNIIIRANTLGKDLFLGDKMDLQGSTSDQTTQYPRRNPAPAPRWPDHDSL